MVRQDLGIGPLLPRLEEVLRQELRLITLLNNNSIRFTLFHSCHKFKSVLSESFRYQFSQFPLFYSI